VVKILCPHCDEEIELDDDSSGIFACPYCDEEFEWNVDPAPSKSGGKAAVMTERKIRGLVYTVCVVFSLAIWFVSTLQGNA
jgi:ribosomal protein L37AE/L43A